jgi:hypothetical protein
MLLLFILLLKPNMVSSLSIKGSAEVTTEELKVDEAEEQHSGSKEWLVELKEAVAFILAN